MLGARLEWCATQSKLDSSGPSPQFWSKLDIISRFVVDLGRAHAWGGSQAGEIVIIEREHPMGHCAFGRDGFPPRRRSPACCTNTLASRPGEACVRHRSVRQRSYNLPIIIHLLWTNLEQRI